MFRKASPTRFRPAGGMRVRGRGAVRSMCYLFCRCTRAVSVCPPAYYAHRAAMRGRQMVNGRPDSDSASVSAAANPTSKPVLLKQSALGGPYYAHHMRAVHHVGCTSRASCES